MSASKPIQWSVTHESRNPLYDRANFWFLFHFECACYTLIYEVVVAVYGS